MLLLVCPHFQIRSTSKRWNEWIRRGAASVEKAVVIDPKRIQSDTILNGLPEINKADGALVKRLFLVCGDSFPSQSYFSAVFHYKIPGFGTDC